MRTELPVRCEFAAAFETFVEELVPFLMQLQQCRLHPALLGLLMLFLVVHGVPLRGIEHSRLSTSGCVTLTTPTRATLGVSVTAHPPP